MMLPAVSGADHKRCGGSTRSLTRISALIASVACLVILPAVLPTSAIAATASWSFEPGGFDFGALIPGEKAPEPAHLRLTNTGDVRLSPALISLDSEGAFALAYNGCDAPIAPGGGCSVEVTFRPGSPGPKEAALEVSEREGTVPPAVARLTGAGVSPTVSIDPTAVDFGTIQAGAMVWPPRTVTVTNQGPSELFISSLEMFENSGPAKGLEPIRWVGGTCHDHLSLPPGGSCTFMLEFGSSDPVSASAEMRITDDALDSPQIVHVSGTASPAPPREPPPPPAASPRATLSGHPSKRTKARITTFEFSGNEGTTWFECHLDSGPFRRCTSPARYRSLKAGKHQFWVRPIATNPSAVLGPALNYSWRIIGPRHQRHGSKKAAGGSALAG
jgi:hypothetical protein